MNLKDARVKILILAVVLLIIYESLEGWRIGGAATKQIYEPNDAGGLFPFVVIGLLLLLALVFRHRARSIEIG